MSALLKLAVKARLPLIEVTCTDSEVRCIELLRDCLPKASHLPTSFQSPPNGIRVPALLSPTKGTAYYSVGGSLRDGETAVANLTRAETTLVIVNPAVPSPMAFLAGELLPSEAVLSAMLSKISDSPEELLPILRGLSFKKAGEIIALCSAQYGDLSPASLRKTRAVVLGGAATADGLLVIETKPDPLYFPPEALEAWLTAEGPFFRTRSALSPRGLLFDGFPGTGKTAGAKFLARKLKVPLLRLDFGALLTRWLGEADQNLRQALRSAEASAPCVLLLDEVEKLFAASSSDEGTTRRLLADLLWWLAEHDSQILTVMTTNAYGAIPPELIRPGRIDRRIVFDPLTKSTALDLAQRMDRRLSDLLKIPVDPSYVRRLMVDLTGPFTYAEIHELVVRAIKLSPRAAKLKGKSS